MPDQSILVSGQSRVFIQKAGANPAAPYLYYGCMSLGGPSQDLGTVNPVYCPSPSARNRWDLVQSVPSTPALGTSDFTAHADRFLKDILWDLKRSGCEFNLTVVNGACQRPDDFTKWDSRLLLVGSRLTNIGLGELNALAGDNNAAVDLSGSLSFYSMEPIYQLLWGSTAETEVTTEILDGLVHDSASCGECGSVSDGCNKLYFLEGAASGSPGLSAEVVYSKDGGLTWAVVDVPPLGGLSANRLEDVGERLVIVSEAAGGHVWEELALVDAGSTTGWVKVTSGYVAGKSPRAIFSKSPSETFIAANGGYIYFMVDPSSAVTVLTDGSVSTQNLNDINGYGRTIVAVGASNAILKSDNAGLTWALVVGPAVGVNLTAIWCLSQSVWLVGTGTGKLYYTLNAGTTWVQISLEAGITVVNDIQFAPGGVVGYMAVEIAGSARVYRTLDSGYSWQYQAPAITSLPTAQRMNVVVPCGYNMCATGGRKTVGGDGVIAIAR